MIFQRPSKTIQNSVVIIKDTLQIPNLIKFLYSTYNLEICKILTSWGEVPFNIIIYFEDSESYGKWSGQQCGENIPQVSLLWR